MRFERIRFVAERRPWTPFTIVLENGERISVTHPENIQLLRWDEFIVYRNGRAWLIGAEAVSAIERRRPKRARR